MKKKIIIGVILIILIAAISVSAAFIVKKQNKSEETNLTNAEEQPKNEETENLTNLGDVAQIGDYVNYMGSDTNWRVIDILDGYQNEKDKIVYLIYSSYLVDDYEAKDYDDTLMRLEGTDIYDEQYLDEKYANEVQTSVAEGKFESALINYYETMPDLFDVGADINLAGEKQLNYAITRLAYYKDGSGEISTTVGDYKNVRPSVALKMNITTTGKNENGAWVLNEKTIINEIETEDTSKNEIEAENKTEDENTTFDKSYLGYYNYENGNDILEFSLEERDEEIEFYMMYYPDNNTSPVEEIWGNWDTTSNNIEEVTNENTYAAATYSFNDIKYDGDKIEINIKANEILNPELKDYVIPEGTYTFVKYE